MFSILATVTLFSKPILVWSFVWLVLVFFVFHVKDEIKLKTKEDYKKYIKIAPKENPVGDDDNENSWKKWFEKNYVKIALGVMLVSGLFLYGVYLNTYNQQEYIYLITKEGAPVPEKCKQGLSFQELGLSKDIFIPYVNLMDHRGFTLQRNFIWVTNILVQLEDKMLIFNSQYKAAVSQGLCEQISSMPEYQQMIALENMYLRIMAPDNPFRRLLVAMDLLSSGEKSTGGFDLFSFLRSEDLYVAHKWEYAKAAAHPKDFPYSEIFK